MFSAQRSPAGCAQVDKLVKNGIIKTKAVEQVRQHLRLLLFVRWFDKVCSAQAMRAVDRGNYCPERANAYEDAPQPIGYSATISAPHSSLLLQCFELSGVRSEPDVRACSARHVSGAPRRSLEGCSCIVSLSTRREFVHSLSLGVGEQGANVLDVGSGSGYLVAAMAHMVKPNGHVYGLFLRSIDSFINQLTRC